ncbi:MAG: GNAT family N-acetyltransferase [Bacteroidota bacterium]
MMIRVATEADIPVVISFQKNMAIETENVVLDDAVVREGLRNLMADASKGKYYVAEENGTIIGCLMTTYEWSDWRNGNVIWIQSVYVPKEHRGKGVYKAMYDFIQQMVKNDPNLRGVRLYVDKRNQAAQQVYEKLGMNGEHYQVYEWMKN